jgi:hypothetical protein
MQRLFSRRGVERRGFLMSAVPEGASSLDDLKNEVAGLERRLSEARARLRKAEIAAAEFKVGDVLEQKVGGTWEPVIVRKVFYDYRQVCYGISQRRKNGEWMNRTQRAWRELRRSSS